MQLFNKYIIYIMMICALLGALASIFDSKSKLGQEFLQGIYSIGYIFMPVAGIMALVPVLSKLIKIGVGPIFQLFGADPAIAATTFIAVDMGGYQLAYTLAHSKESWIMAMITGYMSGATIIFSIPVGLTILEKKDHKYMALGIMSGILTVPIGVFITSIILLMSNCKIRDIISNNSNINYQLMLSIGKILTNLIPIIIVCCLLALGLKLIPNKMINGFIKFGKLMDGLIKLALVLSIIEYFTGFFSNIFGVWNLNPIIADKKDQFRALETAGYIGIMLSGAFPMVYLIQKYFSYPVKTLGKKIGISNYGVTGILGGVANILALFKMVKFMPATDKVKVISFSVCGAFLLGDHLAFTANFQPSLILPLMTGKLIAGIIAIYISNWISVPQAITLEKQEKII